MLTQVKGDFVLTLGIGFISHGGLGLKYFVADGIAFEVHAQVIPHTYNLGIACNLHPFTDDRNEYFIVGYSMFGGSNPYTEYVIKGNDTLIVKNKSATGLNLGFGHQFKLKDRDSFGFFALGGTRILTYQRSFKQDPAYEPIDVPDTTHIWLPFIDGGVNYYLKLPYGH